MSLISEALKEARSGSGPRRTEGDTTRYFRSSSRSNSSRAVITVLLLCLVAALFALAAVLLHPPSRSLLDAWPGAQATPAPGPSRGAPRSAVSAAARGTAAQMTPPRESAADSAASGTNFRQPAPSPATVAATPATVKPVTAAVASPAVPHPETADPSPQAPAPTQPAAVPPVAAAFTPPAQATPAAAAAETAPRSVAEGSTSAPMAVPAATEPDTPIAGVKVESAASPRPGPRFALNGILQSGGRYIALLENRVYSVGDHLDERTLITAITARTVTLDIDGQEKILRLRR